MHVARVHWPWTSFPFITRSPLPVLILLLLLPLETLAAPAPDRLGQDGSDRIISQGNPHQDQGRLHGRQLLPTQTLDEQAMTQTVVQTVVETMTKTAYNIVVTASASSSSAVPGSNTTSADSASLTSSSSSISSGLAQAPALFSVSASPVTSSVSVSESLDAASASAVPTDDATTSAITDGDQANTTQSSPPDTQTTVTAAMSTSPIASFTPAPAVPVSSTPSSLPSSTSAISESSGPSTDNPTSTPVPIPLPLPLPSDSTNVTAPSTNSSTPTDSAPPDGPTSIADPSSNTGHAAAPPAPVRPLVMAYYPDWATSSFPPENIDFDRFDWIDFAFAVPTQNYSIGWDGDDDAPDLLKRLVDAAHQGGKNVKLSVGGWTGSKYFSPAVSTPQNRQVFANNILAVYNSFNLDGIDIDWEFPGLGGNKGNIVNATDSANFLKFLRVLRKTLPGKAKMSAAVMTVPWADSKGQPLKDVSAFASVLDWVLIMNYDTWGSSSTPGPNAPLSNSCHNSTQSSASAVAGVMSWTSAGFPASKIVLGVPSYGYISRSSSTSLVTRDLSRFHVHQRRNLPMHVDPTAMEYGGDDDSDDSIHSEGSKSPSGGTTAVMAHNEDGGTENGQVQFRELVKQGILQYLQAWSAGGSTQAMPSSTDPIAGADNTDTDDDDDDDTDDSASQVQPSPPLTPSGDDPSQSTVTTLTFGNQVISNVFNGLNGFVRMWDACSSSPYLRSEAAKQVVTYDDPQSLEMKAVFVKEAGLLGVNMFDVHGDTDEWDLTDALRRGLGVAYT